MLRDGTPVIYRPYGTDQRLPGVVQGEPTRAGWIRVQMDGPRLVITKPERLEVARE